MKIAIDLNDVVRDFSNNFLKYYITNYNKEFKLDDFEFFTNELNLVLPFASDRAYQKFLYEDYVYELFCKCPYCSSKIDFELNEWAEKTITEFDSNEQIYPMIVSPMEYGSSIGCSYMFLSKMATRIRDIYFPVDSSTIWERCDVLITANPNLLNNKPEGKVSIKIDTDYNKECPCDYSFNSLSKFLADPKNTEILLSHA